MSIDRQLSHVSRSKANPASGIQKRLRTQRALGQVAHTTRVRGCPIHLRSLQMSGISRTPASPEDPCKRPRNFQFQPETLESPIHSHKLHASSNPTQSHRTRLNGAPKFTWATRRWYPQVGWVTHLQRAILMSPLRNVPNRVTVTSDGQTGSPLISIRPSSTPIFASPKTTFPDPPTAIPASGTVA